MRKLTEVLMGSANYLLNPCVLMCPFDGSTCRKVNYRLNGNCKVSQLYSHWSHVHKDNPAAKRMTERWRHAFKNPRITRAQLDEVLPLEWGSEEDEGYEARRRPALGAEQAFQHTFSLSTRMNTAHGCAIPYPRAGARRGEVEFGLVAQLGRGSPSRGAEPASSPGRGARGGGGAHGCAIPALGRGSPEARSQPAHQGLRIRGGWWGMAELDRGWE